MNIFMPHAAAGSLQLNSAILTLPREFRESH